MASLALLVRQLWSFRRTLFTSALTEALSSSSVFSYESLVIFGIFVTTTCFFAEVVGPISVGQQASCSSMDQPVPMRWSLSALAEAAVRLELAVVEEIGPLAALEYVVEDIRPAVGMQPCLV
jgi:hypothetical protein